MKRQWVPIWVRRDSDGSPGNAALLSVHHAQGPPQEVIQQICALDQSATSSEQVEADSLYADTEVGTAPSGAGNVSEQPEHTSPQKQAPSVISDLYGHFIQSLQERLTNGSIEKSELENHYGLVNTQFDTWMKRAVEENVVTKESNPGVLYSLNQQFDHISPQEPFGSSGLYGALHPVAPRTACEQVSQRIRVEKPLWPCEEAVRCLDEEGYRGKSGHQGVEAGGAL